MPASIYQPRRRGRSLHVPLRHLSYHLTAWGDESLVTPQRPPLVLTHGWMDVGASFQFVVDALAAADGFERYVLAPDWRGYGGSTVPPTDSYWFPDYLGDLDALIDHLSPQAPVDLLGHSMGGNVVMSYAGVRPQRVRRLINLEGFGMPRTEARQAPKRLAAWLDELKTPRHLRDYASADEVAQRLMKNDPRLPADKAAWLARHWGEASSGAADARWRLRADPAHKRVNPMLYRVDEILETWQRIEAPLLWLEGDATDIGVWWGQRYTKPEFHQRLGAVKQVERHVVQDSGHMLHHDQPEAVAARISTFLNAP